MAVAPQRSSPPVAEVNLGQEIAGFASAADRVALGDLEIRKAFARNVVVMFAVANAFVLVGLGVVFWQDGLQLAARQVKPDERIINAQVIMAMIGATTVQLGAVIYTITRAVFPSPQGVAKSASGDMA